MSAAELAQRPLALEHDYAQYRVEMALYVDKLERRCEETVRNLIRVSLRSGLFGASFLPHPNTVPGFSEPRPNAQVPPPINTVPVMTPAPAFTPYSSLFAQDPAGSGTPNEGVHHPARGGGHPPKNMGSGKNAAFLPKTIEKIAVTSQKKADGGRRFWLPVGVSLFYVVIEGKWSSWIPTEEHLDWERIVKGSFDSGNFGFKMVKDLYELLFPIEEYPEK